VSKRTTKKKKAQASACAAHDDGLSPKQHGAMLAVLSSPTLDLAAKAAKISRQTLYRWLKEPAFRKALKQARHLAVRQASAYVQGLSGEAAATLMDVIRNKEASVASRVSASRIALEMTYQLLEADEIAERLERLERLKRGEGDGQEPGW
jgi:hypothetical protein